MPGVVVPVFGAAKPHCAYLFANRRANRIKVLVHDGVGISLICHGDWNLMSSIERYLKQRFEQRACHFWLIFKKQNSQ